MADEMNMPAVIDVEVATFRSPDSVVKEAEMVAKAFGKKANQLGLYKQIGESKHLQIEGWQLVASMYRVTAAVTDTRFVSYGDAQGFEATAEAIHVPTGRVISRADAMCLNDEDKWGPVTKYEWQDDPEHPGKRKKVAVGFQNKPLQQLRSMAQTRACSKVLSNIFKPVVKMAGFATTPGEEMMGYEYDQDQQFQEPQRRSASTITEQNGVPRSAGKISEAQRKRLWGIAKGAGKTNDEVLAVLKQHGFERSEDVTSDKYDLVCNELQRGVAAAG